MSNVSCGLLALIIAASTLQGCGKKSDDSKEDQSTEVGGGGNSPTQGGGQPTGQSAENTSEINLGFAAINSKSVGAALALTADNSNAEFRPTSITSGAPDGFRLAITKISLEGDQARSSIFEDAAGAILDIEGSTVDLSSLLATTSANIKADPESKNAVKAAVKPGVYTKIKLEFKRQAEIKGCVSGNFSEMSLESGVHSYCTVAAGSSFSGEQTTNSTFEDKAAEWMTFDLASSNEEYFTTDSEQTFSLDYEISSPVEVSAQQSANMTFVIDMNRLLRYYNRGRTDSGPVPGAPTDKTYFFDSTFRAATFAFVGKPGSIYGYEMLALACADTDYNASANTCSGSSTAVAAWMTLIADENGDPVAVNFMPDDDNTLTVIKGGHRGLSDWSVAGASAREINYTLGEGETGVIKGLPLDLGTTPVGSAVNGGSFDGYQDYSGPVTLTRKL